MVNRFFVEKRTAFRDETHSLANDIRSFLGIDSLEGIRIVNRYDIEGIDEADVDTIRRVVLCEAATDECYDALTFDTPYAFAVEFLPGQFDQRADSAAQCIQLVTLKQRPAVKTARVYMLYGKLAEKEYGAIKRYIINPVDSRETTFEKYETLADSFTQADNIETLKGFCALDNAGAQKLITDMGLAMNVDDIILCRDYFSSEHREPTLTEIKVIDTYWSDHCRHTTFNTHIENVDIRYPRAKAAYERYTNLRETLKRKKSASLMDIGTIAAKYHRATGKLDNLDVSDEINACSVITEADVDGKKEEYLVLFKNETHNHPTEIEPFGGAATCIGGAIRDPLSGRALVYQAMRVTGAANPLAPIEETLVGKLPQKRIVTDAAHGYSSYGNQIGLATGLVDEIYHPGYVAKHLEVGAVIGAVKRADVIREVPTSGDVVILVGGRTGRDGCDGATGSSKQHAVSSQEKCGAQVQKGNAPQERKLQRLFVNAQAVRLIKRCNDFGAGGVSVAVGELANGLLINLDSVRKKYEGLSCTELAISESQERMAVVTSSDDAKRFIELANAENLEAYIVAKVTGDARLVMTYRGSKAVDIKREFLDTNGAPRSINAIIEAPKASAKQAAGETFSQCAINTMRDLNICSKQGLSERFDTTIGARTLMLPFGGKHYATRTQVMSAKLPVDGAITNTATVMSYGFDPYASSENPYYGAYSAVAESVAKLVAAGAPLDECYLTFQEYFPSIKNDGTRFGKPLAALLGALDAQLDLSLSAIGGKDSMSGTFEDIDVPPTLISFAVAICNKTALISPEFKQTGSKVVLVSPELDDDGIIKHGELKRIFDLVSSLIAQKRVLSAYTPTAGGIFAAIMNMCTGNRIGFCFNNDLTLDFLFSKRVGCFILELENGSDAIGTKLGHTAKDYAICYNNETILASALEHTASEPLEGVYPMKSLSACDDAVPVSFSVKERRVSSCHTAAPRVLIPVFAGTNCEFDSARAFERVGAKTSTFVVNTLSTEAVEESARNFAHMLDTHQILFIPGGFSAGDEPDGSGKFIAAFLRNPYIADSINVLLDKHDGLIGGICNGFQALIKLGLVPFGAYSVSSASAPTLTHNTIGRHISRMVHTRIASDNSPWLMHYRVGDVETIPISHGEGRFVCPPELYAELAKKGQIATQYCGANGETSAEYNPNGSYESVEGIISPDGRVFGRMAHAERCYSDLYINAPKTSESLMFMGAADYFRR